MKLSLWNYSISLHSQHCCSVSMSRRIYCRNYDQLTPLHTELQLHDSNDLYVAISYEGECLDIAIEACSSNDSCPSISGCWVMWIFNNILLCKVTTHLKRTGKPGKIGKFDMVTTKWGKSQGNCGLHVVCYRCCSSLKINITWVLQ